MEEEKSVCVCVNLYLFIGAEKMYKKVILISILSIFMLQGCSEKSTPEDLFFKFSHAIWVQEQNFEKASELTDSLTNEELKDKTKHVPKHLVDTYKRKVTTYYFKSNKDDGDKKVNYQFIIPAYATNGKVTIEKRNSSWVITKLEARERESNYYDKQLSDKEKDWKEVNLAELEEK
ncbi:MULTISPECIES: hypothetical protein [Pontibacillus]|uniref:DUF4878 domain-containing protein n=1 Tax=Pontibacillus chungwhensis TaxID=265426 RepID=A0ABY8V302_9BACI|nr:MULTISPECIES: hypothetical protein [Pontibacillus]MCD5324327.1 hypothetical protein [Pontibacillus sp. HN14]WIF99376.1 hypothetical protein QNI29_06880 [Pontibacillus chungwhensis]